MEKFVIDGGTALSGTITPAGNKNGALPILAASVLTEDEVVVRNVPKIKDVGAMLSLLEALGVRIRWLSEHEVSLCAADLTAEEAVIDRELSERIRASFLLAGPLLARFGRVRMPPPGRRRHRPPAPGSRTSTPSPRSARPSSTRATSSCARPRACARATSSWTSRR